MLTRNQKLKYLFHSALAIGQKAACTFCDSTDCTVIDRKYVVTKLLECRNCHLYFRFPVDKKDTNAKFYQTAYQEQDNLTTELPDEDALNLIKQKGFHVANRNADRFLNLFGRLFPSKKELRIVDYGCSWGYLTYQFQQYGHDVQGYEISKSRAVFGSEKLGVQIFTDEGQIRSGNDIFFSSHVIEHHPDIRSMIKLAKSVLRDGGYFIAVSPNGSKEYRKLHENAFHHAWGKVHPNYLNAEFYKYIFEGQSYYIGSSPFSLHNIHPLNNEEITDDLSGEELLIVTRVNKSE
jgi:2-polyprenyl-3-methyl-5-hydroxy-6-metoxy-1,4-benzoquinol methylase